MHVCMYECMLTCMYACSHSFEKTTSMHLRFCSGEESTAIHTHTHTPVSTNTHAYTRQYTYTYMHPTEKASTTAHVLRERPPCADLCMHMQTHTHTHTHIQRKTTIKNHSDKHGNEQKDLQECWMNTLPYVHMYAYILNENFGIKQ